jgi:hypothetical protein
MKKPSVSKKDLNKKSTFDVIPDNVTAKINNLGATKEDILNSSMSPSLNEIHSDGVIDINENNQIYTNIETDSDSEDEVQNNEIAEGGDVKIGMKVKKDTKKKYKKKKGKTTGSSDNMNNSNQFSPSDGRQLQAYCIPKQQAQQPITIDNILSEDDLLEAAIRANNVFYILYF